MTAVTPRLLKPDVIAVPPPPESDGVRLACAGPAAAGASGSLSRTHKQAFAPLAQIHGHDRQTLRAAHPVAVPDVLGREEEAPTEEQAAGSGPARRP
jgi:hypothetical protein